MQMINLKETCRMIQDYKAERDYIIKVKISFLTLGHSLYCPCDIPTYLIQTYKFSMHRTSSHVN